MATIQRVKRKNGYRWHVQVRHSGQKRFATFPTKRQAQEWAVKIENELFNQRYFPERAGEDYTVEDAIARYLKEILPTKAKGSQDKQRQILRWWKQNIGDTNLAHVTPALIERYKQILLHERGLSPYTVNIYLNTIAHVFTVCVSDSWGWMKDHPITGRRVHRVHENRNRVRYLTNEERHRFLAACHDSTSPYIETFVILALATGARKRELLDLTWDCVDFQRNRITFKDTKNKEHRIVPLLGSASAVLQMWYGKVRAWSHKTPYVFPNFETGKPVRSLFFAFKTACKKAGIENFRIHDCRHTFCSYLAMNGANLVEIAKLAGHKHIRETERYTHLTESHIHEVIKKMDDMLY